MAFRVGQKVVCVDDRGIAYPMSCDPVKDSVYEIARVGRYAGFDVVALRECVPPHGWPDWYKSGRFRHIVERKTDISIFTKMLDGAPAKVGADTSA